MVRAEAWEEEEEGRREGLFWGRVVCCVFFGLQQSGSAIEGRCFLEPHAFFFAL